MITHLFADPIPYQQRVTDLRRQTRDFERFNPAHNRKPQKVKMADLRERRHRRRLRAERKRWVLEWRQR